MPDFFKVWRFHGVFGKEIPMKTFFLHIAISLTYTYVQIYVNDDMTYNTIELL